MVTRVKSSTIESSLTGISRVYSGDVTAATFHGALTGNVTGNCSGTALNITGTAAIINGGTGATDKATALNNLCPTGQVAGYVLATGGVGNYYWAAGGTGGGSSIGTTINTTRSVVTATAGQTAFTTPSYVVGTGQLRVYIDGVRQFASQYTETNTTTVTFNAPGVALNSVVLLEVDGYILYTPTASGTTFTPVGSITAIDVQNAIASLESSKALVDSPTFTGVPSAPTAAPGTSTTQIATTAFVTSAPAFPAGTRMIFNQTAAPTGWTKDTTAALNDSALRIVTGAIGSGGSVAFSTAFTSYTPAGTVNSATSSGTVAASGISATADSHVLTIAEMPSHTHTSNVWSTISGATSHPSSTTGATITNITTGATGGDGGHTHTVSGGSHVHGLTMNAHSHTFAGTAINLTVKYVDFIIASKN